MPFVDSRAARTVGRRLDAANRIAAALFFSLLLAAGVWAATPSSGTLTPTTTAALTWVGDAPGTAAQSANASNETACMDSGAARNCDTFTLTLAPGDYSGKILKIAVNWSLPTDEYDLFVHSGSLTGPLVATSANGVADTTTPATTNAIGIPVPSAGTYVVHVAYAVTPGAGPANTDQYKGVAVLSTNTTSGRYAHYSVGGLTFGTDVPLKSFGNTTDSEPGIRIDKLGNTYESGIRGFPAGVDLWYFDLNPTSPTYDPQLKNPLYRGQPDGFTGPASGAGGINAGGDGGGDIDLAVGFPEDGSLPTLAFSSLIAANLSVGKSTDTGKTFQLNSAGNLTGGVPGDDRQWLEFFGKSTCYLLYRTLDPAVTQIQRSDDGGFTYGPAATAGQIGQTGSIDVDPVDGTVVIAGSTGVVAVGTPSIPGMAPLSTDYHVYPVASDPNGVDHLFFQVQVAKDAGVGPGKNGKPYGTMYAFYSNDFNVYLEHSLDRGKTWSQPVQVNAPGLGTITHVFPRMALGPKYGQVGFVWYGTVDKGRTPNSVGSPNALWRVYYARTTNATFQNPTFQEQQASNHAVHAGNISEGGLVTPPNPNPNRNLGDYFELAYDPDGAAVISYGDDHNDLSGIPYAVRQTAGPGITGANVPARTPGNVTPPPPPAGAPPYPADGSQVVDFAQDQSSALVATTPTTSPIDILSILYSVEPYLPDYQLVATMKVSNLSTVPPSSTWRMDFTANAPLANYTPANSLFSYGVSDLGDQFYVEADTSRTGAATFVYGTVVRNSDGTLTYTPKGPADTGIFDTKNNVIEVEVGFSKLNKLITHGPTLQHGSLLSGLRGETTGTASGVALSDTTYGGKLFKIP